MGVSTCILCHGNKPAIVDENISNILYSNRSAPSTSLPKDYSLSFKLRSINYSDKNTSSSVIPYYTVSQLTKQQTFQNENEKKQEKMCEIGFWISILGLLCSFTGVAMGLLVYIMDFYFASQGLKTRKRGNEQVPPSLPFAYANRLLACRQPPARLGPPTNRGYS